MKYISTQPLTLSLSLPLSLCVIAVYSGFCFATPTFAQENIATALAAIKSVDVEGAGHDEAIAAMGVLNNLSAEQVPELLIGMDGANKLARNWIRAAIQTAQQNGGRLPVERIKAYFEDSQHSQMGRLLAFNILKDNDDSIEAKIVPTLIDDPCLPLRRMAITAWIEKAQVSEGPQAIGALGLALDKARDLDQVTTIVTMLADHGIKIDTQQQLGFINDWHIVGPFDNTDEEGFDTPGGPEKSLDKIDLEATYADGKDGKNVAWIKRQTIEGTGTVDLNEVVDKIKSATAYAYSNFECAESTEVEIRIGCINGNKVWVNGELIISNEVYHVGMQPDQFTGTATLKEGANSILIKVCQNDQSQPWAQNWMFQLRVCDETGKAISPSEKEDVDDED